MWVHKNCIECTVLLQCSICPTNHATSSVPPRRDAGAVVVVSAVLRHVSGPGPALPCRHTQSSWAVQN